MTDTVRGILDKTKGDKAAIIALHAEVVSRARKAREKLELDKFMALMEVRRVVVEYGEEKGLRYVEGGWEGL